MKALRKSAVSLQTCYLARVRNWVDFALEANESARSGRLVAPRLRRLEGVNHEETGEIAIDVVSFRGRDGGPADGFAGQRSRGHAGEKTRCGQPCADADLGNIP